MCKSSNQFPLQTSLDTSAMVQGLTASVSTALAAVKSHNNNINTTKTRSGSKNRKHHPHIVVEHHYHDHVNEAATVAERPARGGVTTPFPIRLHEMLEKMEVDGHGDVISWQPHGRCFVVRKPKEFRELLPAYFKLSKMASFQRQLNLYGFQRLTRGKDKNAYYHEYFLRGKTGLSSKIQRTKVKGTGVRARSSPATEPHLWELPWATAGDDNQSSHGGSDSGSVTTQEQESDEFTSPKTSPAVAKKLVPMAITSYVMPPLPVSSADASLPPLAYSSSMSMPSWPYPQQMPQERVGQDTVLSFGGKSFHYLDPEELAIEARLRQKQKEDMQTFMSNLELDNLYSELDDATMDNDDKFMAMLERVVCE